MKKMNKTTNLNIVKFPKKLSNGEREVEAIVFEQSWYDYHRCRYRRHRRYGQL